MSWQGIREDESPVQYDMQYSHWCAKNMVTGLTRHVLGDLMNTKSTHAV